MRRTTPGSAPDGDLVTVLVPKFTEPLRAALVPCRCSPQPDFRVHLDDVGSFVWQQCDGRTTVRAIGDAGRSGSAGDARTAAADAMPLRAQARA